MGGLEYTYDMAFAFTMAIILSYASFFYFLFFQMFTNFYESRFDAWVLNQIKEKAIRQNIIVETDVTFSSKLLGNF